MGHHSQIFPLGISYGSQSGFGFLHGIVELGSGASEYIARHSEARHMFDVAFGIKSPEQLLLVKSFYLARGGLSNSFLFQDPADMNTSPTPFVIAGGPGATTELDVALDTGATTGQNQVQLIKRYSSGSESYLRTIRHPINNPGGDDGIKLSVEPIPGSGPVSFVENTDYTVDYDTGMINFSISGGLAENDIVRAGFNFYCRGRFGKEIDQLLSMTFESFSTGGFGAIPITVDIQSTSHRDDYHYGHGSLLTSDNFSWSPVTHGLAITHQPSAAGTVVMPEPGDFAIGGLYMIYKNNQDTHTVTFVDEAGITLWTVAPNKGAMVVIADAGSGAVKWDGALTS